MTEHNPPAASPDVPKGARSRPGFAMFMALGALVIVAALVAGSSFITLQETHLGQSTMVQHKAFAVAEYGLNKIQEDWDKTPNLSMTPGDTWSTEYTLTGQGAAYVKMTRLNDETFWIVSRGNAHLGIAVTGARTAIKRVGAVLRLRTPSVTAEAAVTTGGNLSIGGNALTISGEDKNPGDWGDACGAPGAAKKGAIVPPDHKLEYKGKGATPAIDWATDPAAADASTYIEYGEETWTTLVQQANHVFEPAEVANAIQLRPSAVDGVCNKSDKFNWGEPWRSGDGHTPSCYNFFPIIYVKGTEGAGSTTLKTNGKRGQGILLIDGNLSIHGNFDWYGLIVATGSITNSGGTPNIVGAVMAASDIIPEDIVEGGDDGSSATGNITYQFSSCALERALRGSALVQQARHRAWAELF